MIGSLMYLCTYTRPDISFSISFLSKYLHKPTKELLNLCIRVFRYLKFTKSYKLLYKRKENFNIKSYCDASFASDKTTMKGVSGFIILFNEFSIIWRSKRQEIVCLSSTESEILSLTVLVQELIWLKNILSFLSNLQLINLNEITVYQDNQSCINLFKNNNYSDRTKHISIKIKFIIQEFKKLNFKLLHCTSNDMIADMFTKSQSKQQHYKFIDLHNLNEF